MQTIKHLASRDAVGCQSHGIRDVCRLSIRGDPAKGVYQRLQLVRSRRRKGKMHLELPSPHALADPPFSPPAPQCGLPEYHSGTCRRSEAADDSQSPCRRASLSGASSAEPRRHPLPCLATDGKKSVKKRFGFVILPVYYRVSRGSLFMCSMASTPYSYLAMGTKGL